MKLTVSSRPAGFHASFLLLLLAVALSAGGALAQEPDVAEPETAAAGAPAWLEEALAREVSEALPRVDIAVNEAFDLNVPARPVSQTLTDEVHDARYDIGSEAPARCLLWTVDVDLGGILFRQTEALWTALADRLELRRLARVDARVVSAQPAIAVDWIYRVKGEEGSYLGLLKMRVARKRGLTTMCLHDELGYEASFDAFFDAYVESLSFRDGGLLEDPVDYREIAIGSVGDQNISVTEMSLTRTGDDEVEQYSRDTTLVPVDAETLSTSDSVKLVTSDLRGRVLRQLDADSESGSLLMNLELVRGEEEAWAVSGTLQGKEFAATFDGPPPVSEFGMLVAAREAFERSAEERQLNFGLFLPDADPTGFLQGSMAIGPQSKAPYDADVAIGPMELSAKLAGNGTVFQARLEQMDPPLILRLVHREGTAP